MFFCVYLLGVVITPLAGRFILGFGFLRSLFVGARRIFQRIDADPASLIDGCIAGLAICSSGIFICQSATISLQRQQRENRPLISNGAVLHELLRRRRRSTLIGGLAYEAGGWIGSVRR